MARLFRGRAFPTGQVMDHPGDFNTYRRGSAEKRAADRLSQDALDALREAAEVHRHVRSYAQSIIKPGLRLVDMCEGEGWGVGRAAGG